jgi:hypothetical protein
VLITATLTSTVCRYMALRTWVFGHPRSGVAATRTALRALPE